MIRILLVDDQEIVRFALGAVLKTQSGVEVVGTTASIRDAIRFAGELKPNIIITETVTSEFNAIDAAAQIIEQSPDTRLIALTARQEEPIVCQAMKARFSGYVLKKCAFTTLLDAIRAVSCGQMFLCPEVVGAVVSNGTNHTHTGTINAEGKNGSKISVREKEVLQLVAEGLSTKEVADRLSISLKTVETHRRRVMAKLKIFSVAQLTKYAIREGLTTV